MSEVKPAKSSNRLLAGFGIGIAILVLVTVVIVLFQAGKSSPLLPADTPEGTVQRYLLALKEGDYTAARTYLLYPDPKTAPPGYPEYPRPYPPPISRPDNAPGWKATLGRTTVNGDQANIEVIVDVFRGRGGPFDNPVQTSRVIFTLQKQDGVWKITSPLDAYWIY
ncbi:MAG: hypothetical protein HYX90_04320 [Chloroflexi bacterium]|nr:hypothetical protein [Chloroflexota bacterium]